MDRAIVRAAATQHGVVSYAQLVAIGLRSSGVGVRISAGRLHRLHRGVYSVSPPRLLAVKGRWLAAVMACGEGAVLSHMDAAALWELMSAPRGPIHVTIPTDNGRERRTSIVLHRALTLLPSQTTVRSSIPVTNPARTVSDLRRLLSRPRFEPILRRAEILRLDIGPQQEHIEEADRTELERRMLALCRRHGLPMPRCQQIIGAYTVDFLWPDARLVVEVDGWKTHGTRSAFESDRSRDAELQVAGYRVVRFTWRQVTENGPAVAATIRALLGT
jgi:very-short-patch-repair endonuclease